MKISEREFAEAVNSRSKAPIYEKMKSACVGIAGLGGLGSNIAAALVRSGIGRLVLADFDTVELSNINRQAYFLRDVGRRKTEALAEILREINPFCEIITHDVRVDEKNCLPIFGECPIVCEAFDGAEEKVTLLCKNDMMNYIVDKFGNEVETSPVDKDFFEATADISVSQTFFAWVFQFNGDIKITSPSDVVLRYREMLQNALK